MSDRLKFALWVIVTDGNARTVGAYHQMDLEISCGDVVDNAKRILASMNDVIFDPEDESPGHLVLMDDDLGPRLFTVEGFECMPLNRGEHFEFRRVD